LLPIRRRWPGYTAAIIASDQLGATGLNGDAFMLIAQEDLDAALAALAQGDIEDATRRFALVDRDLASASEEGLSAADALQARASILAMSDALCQYASYFGPYWPMPMNPGVRLHVGSGRNNRPAATNGA
jgi:hypothetical protein